MSNVRAIRYRRLALASSDKANTDLLLKLADECDQGILCTVDRASDRLPSKMSSRQKRETTSSGLSEIRPAVP
jgi:hypothetical protein